ncbi:MAG: hypothetical protein IK038_03195 [Bacteroidaceae bacterium]|nr:hypothetical protein [Bacteroidaceae bacterium]
MADITEKIESLKPISVNKDGNTIVTYPKEQVDALMDEVKKELASWEAGYNNLLNVEVQRILKSRQDTTKKLYWMTAMYARYKASSMYHNGYSQDAITRYLEMEKQYKDKWEKCKDGH